MEAQRGQMSWLRTYHLMVADTKLEEGNGIGGGK